MNAFQGMDRYRKEVIQVSTQKNDIKDHYLNNNFDLKIRRKKLMIKALNLIHQYEEQA